ncbi:hypothetical protein [Lentilactobacillus sp. Marseille-Q4993]|uniref:hypothetical protein n=1 Tax=Lentilactobacillus sp. Marseille-Q4993 TaxID=3039492 RepID=UPI0024BC83CD|nr:hypothetical protein [Lentilactobacillus sp. Marseille-Q4993]
MGSQYNRLNDYKTAVKSDEDLWGRYQTYIDGHTMKDLKQQKQENMDEWEKLEAIHNSSKNTPQNEYDIKINLEKYIEIDRKIDQLTDAYADVGRDVNKFKDSMEKNLKILKEAQEKYNSDQKQYSKCVSEQEDLFKQMSALSVEIDKNQYNIV